eukprot:358424-Chlamydomonas_euryale.AAC.3
MVLEKGRLFAAACAADPLTEQTWPRAAAWGPPKGWPLSAPACADAHTHACMRAHATIHSEPQGALAGCRWVTSITKDVRVKARIIS